ncbi:MAG: NAD-dependent epimerase/dehydratase family protein [Bacteroidales bacterium]|jgi:nucleoside-diphosphate-sugar epimerase|nr:NAD-dependent epimerase/dehydratase family protein [Bacteroidales bacterium]
MKVIITGSSGMVGKAALLECISSPEVERVLVINRKSINISHPKLNEIVHNDFSDFSSIKNHLSGYNICFHCMGISALGLNEDKYSHITYTMTNALAETLLELNPNTVFNYVSGAGTDSSEKGKIMWARVKGKTENRILSIGFKDAYAFRPGIILPEKGIKSRTGWYNLFYTLTKPIFPLLKKSDSVITSSQLGKAMINIAVHPQELKHLENRDIKKIARL